MWAKNSMLVIIRVKPEETANPTVRKVFQAEGTRTFCDRECFLCSKKWEKENVPGGFCVRKRGKMRLKA